LEGVSFRTDGGDRVFGRNPFNGGIVGIGSALGGETAAVSRFNPNRWNVGWTDSTGPVRRVPIGGSTSCCRLRCSSLSFRSILLWNHTLCSSVHIALRVAFCSLVRESTICCITHCCCPCGGSAGGGGSGGGCCWKVVGCTVCAVRSVQETEAVGGGGSGRSGDPEASLTVARMLWLAL